MSRECVTHHHACDCREAKFAELEAENAKMHKLWLESERRLADEQVKVERQRELLQEVVSTWCADTAVMVNVQNKIAALLEKGNE